MAAIVWTDVSSMFAKLASVPPAAQAAILAVVNTRLPVDRIDGEDGPVVHLARIYLAAHMTAPVTQGLKGAVVSQTSGPLTQTFAAPATTSELQSTSYGRAYLQLVRPYFAGPVVAGGTR